MGSSAISGDYRYSLRTTHTDADCLKIERRGIRGPKEYEWIAAPAEYTWNETTACKEWLMWVEAEVKRRQTEQASRAAVSRTKAAAQVAAGGIP